MTKIIATMNMTLDGFCDHTVMNADDELHDHYTKLIQGAGALLYGRITYQLMEDYWPNLVKNPSGDRSMDEFALAIHNVPKIVFSHSLNKVDWNNSTIAKKPLGQEGKALKASGKYGKNDIYVGSPSLISTLSKLDLIDEYQLCVHPVLAGKGLPLFKDIEEKKILKHIRTKPFVSGAMAHYFSR